MSSGNDSFVVDADALARLHIADVIADYSEGEVLDLSAMLDGLVSAALPTPVTPGPTPVVPDVGMVEVAPLSGLHHTISILYDDSGSVQV